MKYKALIFDLDGTAIPKAKNGLPSKRVIKAVEAAKKMCHVSVATGRPYDICNIVLDELGISDLCILNGGSHLYSNKSHDYIWKREIDSETLSKLFAELRNFSSYSVADEKRLENIPITKYRTDEPVALSCIFAVEKKDIDPILEIINRDENITGHAMSSWASGKFDIHITNKLATKRHALQSLLEIIGVDKDEVMAVGDGGNDIPLFELAGLKVSMGNGEEKLKQKADWIAPDVEHDGLAVAIEKFILNA